MGEELGQLYFALWQSIAALHLYWHEYVELFGTEPSRIDILNRAAPSFFHMLQEELWDMSLLQLARITDPANSAGRANLTIRALPSLIIDPKLKIEVSKLVDDAVIATNFCRDWRNRKIAHHDLKLTIDESAKPLADASRLDIKNALTSTSAVINSVCGHFFQSEIKFDLIVTRGGALSLLSH